MRCPRRCVFLLLIGFVGIASTTWNAACGGGGSNTPSSPDTTSTAPPSWVKVASASPAQGAVGGQWGRVTVSYHVGEVIHGEVWVSSYLSLDGRTQVCGNGATGSGKRVLQRTDSLVQIDGTVMLSPGMEGGPARCGTGPLDGQPMPQNTGYILTYMTEVQPGGGMRTIAQEAYPWAWTWW
jgi:hypothetical protein